MPGLRLLLTAEEAGSLTVGAPVYHRGFEVGRIEGRELDKQGLKVTYNAFIREEYSLVGDARTRGSGTPAASTSAPERMVSNCARHHSRRWFPAAYPSA